MIYWPGINKDIKILVKTCDVCQENSQRNNKDPVLAREIPIFPWTLLEMDLFMMDDHSFLLVVDVTSQFPVIRILNNETCRSVLNTRKGIYCDFGLPKMVLSENGPCFKEEEFVNFHIKLGVTVEKCSSYNHQSVGCVECMVQTVKQIMTRNAENAWLVMLIFKATDIPGINKSPSELLNSRKYRTNLPTIDLSQKSNGSEIDKLVERQFSKSKLGIGKELSKIPVVHPYYMRKTPIQAKLSVLIGAKAQ